MANTYKALNTFGGELRLAKEMVGDEDQKKIPTIKKLTEAHYKSFSQALEAPAAQISIDHYSPAVLAGIEQIRKRLFRILNSSDVEHSQKIDRIYDYFLFFIYRCVISFPCIANKEKFIQLDTKIDLVEAFNCLDFGPIFAHYLLPNKAAFDTNNELQSESKIVFNFIKNNQKNIHLDQKTIEQTLASLRTGGIFPEFFNEYTTIDISFLFSLATYHIYNNQKPLTVITF